MHNEAGTSCLQLTKKYHPEFKEMSECIALMEYVACACELAGKAGKYPRVPNIIL